MAAVSIPAKAGDPSPRAKALTVQAERQKPDLYTIKVQVWRLIHGSSPHIKVQCSALSQYRLPTGVHLY